MASKFHPVPADCIDFIPSEALGYLERACKSNPAPVLGPRDIVLRIRCGIGNFFIVEHGDEIVGIFYIHFVNGQYGKCLNIVEFSGDKFDLWREDAREFLLELLRSTNSQNIIAVTRKGMEKLLPEFQPIGITLEYRVTH